MTVQVDDVVRVTADFTPAVGSTVQNVFHLQNKDVAVSEAGALTDILVILEALYAIINAIIHASQTFDTIRAINVTQETDVGVAVPADTTPFSGTGEVSPLQNAWGLNLTTERLNVYGRKFWGSAIETQSGNTGILTGTAITAVAASGDFMTALQVATNSEWEFGVVAGSDGAFLPFLSYSLPVTVVTQRRRRLGVGI